MTPATPPFRLPRQTPWGVSPGAGSEQNFLPFSGTPALPDPLHLLCVRWTQAGCHRALGNAGGSGAQYLLSLFPGLLPLLDGAISFIQLLPKSGQLSSPRPRQESRGSARGEASRGKMLPNAAVHPIQTCPKRKEHQSSAGLGPVQCCLGLQGAMPGSSNVGLGNFTGTCRYPG